MRESEWGIQGHFYFHVTCRQVTLSIRPSYCQPPQPWHCQGAEGHNNVCVWNICDYSCANAATRKWIPDLFVHIKLPPDVAHIETEVGQNPFSRNPNLSSIWSHVYSAFPNQCVASESLWLGYRKDLLVIRWQESCVLVSVSVSSVCLTVTYLT